MLYIAQIPVSFYPSFLDTSYVLRRADSEWVGSYAAQLGVSGAVTSEAFTRALAGFVGEKKIRTGTRNVHQDRAGWLLTFSPPKSISVQALVAGDVRIIKAHEQAMRHVRDYIEHRTAARITVDCVTNRFITGKLFAAQFNRASSRSGDPHLHSHLLIFNVTCNEDANTRNTYAIDASWMYYEKHLLGAVYRSCLLRKVRELGYKPRAGKDFGWEVDCIGSDVIELFSSRSEYIEEHSKTIAGTGEPAPVKLRAAVAKLNNNFVEDRGFSATLISWNEALDRANIKLNSRPKAAKFRWRLPTPRIIRDALKELASQTLKCPLGVLKAHILDQWAGDYLIEDIDVAMETMRKGHQIAMSEFHAHIGSAPPKPRKVARRTAPKQIKKKTVVQNHHVSAIETEVYKLMEN